MFPLLQNARSSNRLALKPQYTRNRSTMQRATTRPVCQAAAATASKHIILGMSACCWQLLAHVFHTRTRPTYSRLSLPPSEPKSCSSLNTSTRQPTAQVVFPQSFLGPHSFLCGYSLALSSSCCCCCSILLAPTQPPRPATQQPQSQSACWCLLLVLGWAQQTSSTWQRECRLVSPRLA